MKLKLILPATGCFENIENPDALKLLADPEICPMCKTILYAGMYGATMQELKTNLPDEDYQEIMQVCRDTFKYNFFGIYIETPEKEGK